MNSGVAVERVTTLDPVALARCDFRYPFDSAFAVPRGARLLAVVRLGGQAVGYLACLRDGDAGEVRRLEIDRAHRGQGLGRLLLEEARYWAAEQGLTSLVLETLADNPDAAAFFARQGFTQIHEAEALHWRLPLRD